MKLNSIKKLYGNHNRFEIISLNISSFRTGAGVLLFSFILYVTTLAPTVIWGDSASFAVQVMEMSLKVGAARHPLFIILGRLFSYLPFEIAYSLNLLSAVTASLTVLMVYLTILEITGSRVSAIIGAASLAFSHAFWLHAVIAEVYDLNAFFVIAIILVLLKWRQNPQNPLLLYLAAFLFGLGLSNHLVMALELFGFLFLVIITDYRILFRLKVLLITICSFLIGNSILIYLFIQKLTSDCTVSVVMDAATGYHFKKVMLVLSVGVFKDMGKYFSYLFYQFPLVGFLLGFIGIFTLLKKGGRITGYFLLLLIGVNMFFFLTFGPGVQRTTKYTFYISDYAIFSILIGCGFFAFLRYLENREYSINTIVTICIILIILLPVSLYNITPYASKALGIDLLHTRNIPYRDTETYFLNPSKRGYMGAARYAEKALNTASSGSIIIADFTIFAVLIYFQKIKRVRNDILVLFTKRPKHNIPQKVVSTHYGKRDIYLADLDWVHYRIRQLKEGYDFIPEGVLYKIVEKDLNKSSRT